MDLREIVSELRGLLAEAAWSRMFRHSGIMRSSRYLPARLKRVFEGRYAMRERADIALAVASMYPGGDYFEFGCAGFRTFRNFLTAFDLNDRPALSPDTRFFAFDVFGDVDAGGGPRREAEYFEHYRGDEIYRKNFLQLKRHQLLADRIEIVKGYFEDTLNEKFRARLRNENRRVGFAFLDCNIGSSYKTCFDFLEEFIQEGRAFVYMDEYFCTEGVPELFEKFCSAVRQRHHMRAHYVRNAGGFGALFCFMRAEAAE
jgi:hypothetical protein